MDNNDDDDVQCLGDVKPPHEEDTITLSDVIAYITTESSQDSPTKEEACSPSQEIIEIDQGDDEDIMANESGPRVHILEQPASKGLRFRYPCEGRSAGSIPGANSSADQKTFPTIQVVGYKGPAVVLVSCVTKDYPHRPHPHNLVGRDNCEKGVCRMQFPEDTMTISFSNLGIQCVKKKDIAEHLEVRKTCRVDPFRTGFAHKNQPTSIDLNVVRLCFQVFIPNVAKGQSAYTVPLPPVVSEPIYDKKAMSDLTIVKLSDCTSPVEGGRKDIILLCEKVTKEDIEVRFFEERDGRLVWDEKADFQPSQVHKQTAIWFRAPRYKDLTVTDPVKVNIQLRRPSDGATSEPLPFEMLPLDSGSSNRKRKLNSESSNLSLLGTLQKPFANNNLLQPSYNIPNHTFDIKQEPLDPQPSPHASPNFVVNYGGGPSVSPNYNIPLANNNLDDYQYYPSPAAGLTLPTPLESPSPANNTWNNVGVSVQQPQQAVPISDGSERVDLNTGMSVDSSRLYEILNLDGINANELAQIDLDANMLSANLSSNLSLNDGTSGVRMTSDSLTRLAETRYDAIMQQQPPK